MWKSWKKPAILILTMMVAAISVATVLHVQTKPAGPAPSNAAFTSCGPPKHITLADLEALTTNTIIPDKRSLTPPCSITYNGITYPTYVELDAMTILYTPYTGDCDSNIQGYCDVHLEFGCTISAGCLFEIDQYWFAAGYQYPVNTQGIGSISAGSVVNATGFLYVDDHGIHELHPVASVSVYGSPPPPCTNGAVDPPSCVTCPSGQVMQNGVCGVPPPPLSTGFAYSPTNPSTGSTVTFTSATSGGESPYTISWTFGDGTTGTGATVTHAYSKPQSYTVRESASDAGTPVQTATSSATLLVSTTPPPSLTASITPIAGSVLTGQSVSLASTASGGASPYTYSWSFGDGTSSTIAQASHTYTAPGVYTVSLLVTDSKGLTGTANTVVSVIGPNYPPTLTVPGTQTLTAGTGVTFGVSATDANPGLQVIVTASGLPSGATFDTSTLVFKWTPSTSQAGSYRIVFQATDTGTSALTVRKPVNIQVEPAAPSGGSGGSNGGLGLTCSFCSSLLRPTISTLGYVFAGAIGLVILPLLMVMRSRSKLRREKERLLEPRKPTEWESLQERFGHRQLFGSRSEDTTRVRIWSADD